MKKLNLQNLQSAGLIIAICFGISLAIFHFVFGNPSNFMGGNSANNPLPGNLLGTIHKGGMIVPVIQTLLLTVIVLSIERMFAIGKARGHGDLTGFVAHIKAALTAGDISKAEELCKKQGGSVANVVSSSLRTYQAMVTDTSLSKEQKMAAIQKTIEETTALELPIMEQNLPVIATITTLGTLMGLLGTVLGMIIAFAALGNAGSPDSVALSTGISEALVNTAFGIATGALAVISYNYFTTKIDKITYAIDEIGFSIVQTFSVSQR